MKEGVMSRHCYDKNNFVAQFDFRGIEYESEARIQYRLIGANNKTEWKEIASSVSEVEYSSLAPGTYEFQIRVKYHSAEMVVKKYPFEISPPFWQTWTFFLLLFITTALLVLILFRVLLPK